ncbi:MAG: pyruvate dehydrogenase complex dihydrolipoamide acetyltransferase [Bacteroidetes bacterium]|nr:pyruvate dehydrogenase complex dihydrolipoamide acetyltransferase [Bacteroidota bacterium]MBK7431598.1 pyruvate dehydrogenase complex dihydrolipoamide acetyltransferase [Bacteroidota bacterium]MBK7572845.1 pyruvate dehydrogenase complex dihydrolipoamide acetyltransferase [Bacteroidota bacterium]MBK8585829.1 pyruvate dehydrogenase complex dihydrolipoamide acetyltransferase [Bacteroidota bacterium]
MAEIVRMPKMSDTMTEGVVAKWHKKVGDPVKSGELVAEIETDKATMEFESYQEGVLLYRGVEEGKAAPVNGVLAILGKAGEDYKALLASETAAIAEPAPAPKEAAAVPVAATAPTAKKEVAAPAPEAKAAPAPAVSAPATSSDDRMKASPLARRLANEKGVDLSKVMGSGNDGRIVKRDIDWFKPGMSVQSAGTFSNAITEESYDEIAVSQMRKTIAKRLAESKFTAPHFYLTIEVDMDNAISARESINAVTGSKVSFNDFVIKAVAASLRQHPKINSSWLGDKIRVNHHVHIGVAVAVEDGLLVPVVRFADSKSLREINAEVKEYAKKAKEKKLQPSDWEGNTFTISNLGMYGIEEFTAIINPPDACILAIGGIQQRPVVKNNQIVAGNVMKVTLSCDHRVVDGVSGSEFLRTFKGLLENPVVLLGQASI